MAEASYDLIVVGGGPGGYTGAIRAAQLGMKVAVVEKRATLGGTCLNVGCIPSKALLHTSELFHAAGHSYAGLGIKTGKVELDLPAMQKHKNDVVGSNTKGIEFLFKKHKIDWLKGAGKLLGGARVEVTGADGGKQVATAKAIVLATGSDVTPLKGLTIDEKQVVSSTGALELTKVPKTMVVIGGGVIGLELGSVWSRLGADVTVVEFLDRILPGMDGEISRQALRILERQGLKFKLGTKVVEAKAAKTGVTLKTEAAKGGDAAEISAEVVLVAIGRKPYTDGLGLEAAGVQLDERGRIKTDAHYRTTAAGIYAIGDVIAGPMLAHKAEEEAVILAETLTGQKPHMNYDAIPGIVYTWPEIAAVGKTEEELKAANVTYKVGKFPFTANARARAMAATDGFVKILEDQRTKRVVGAHIIGPNAGDLLAEITAAIEYGASAEDIARVCHAHPTLTEAVKEAALAVEGRTLNM